MRPMLARLTLVCTCAFIAFVLCAFPACPPAPVPPSPPDASVEVGVEDVAVEAAAPDVAPVVPEVPMPQTPCSLACGNLAILGCPGNKPNCLATCEHVTMQHLTELKLPCLTKAKSCDEAIACGTLTRKLDAPAAASASAAKKNR